MQALHCWPRLQEIKVVEITFLWDILVPIYFNSDVDFERSPFILDCKFFLITAVNSNITYMFAINLHEEPFFSFSSMLCWNS